MFMTELEGICEIEIKKANVDLNVICSVFQWTQILCGLMVFNPVICSHLSGLSLSVSVISALSLGFTTHNTAGTQRDPKYMDF